VPTQQHWEPAIGEIVTLLAKPGMFGEGMIESRKTMRITGLGEYNWLMGAGAHPVPRHEFRPATVSEKRAFLATSPSAAAATAAASTSVTFIDTHKLINFKVFVDGSIRPFLCTVSSSATLNSVLRQVGATGVTALAFDSLLVMEMQSVYRMGMKSLKFLGLRDGHVIRVTTSPPAAAAAEATKPECIHACVMVIKTTGMIEKVYCRPCDSVFERVSEAGMQQMETYATPRVCQHDDPHWNRSGSRKWGCDDCGNNDLSAPTEE